MNRKDFEYDLVLKDGHVLDPNNGIDMRMDVGVKDGKVAAVSINLPEKSVRTLIRIPGYYVTPGLIDLHTHIYGFKDWIFPDEYAFPNGVTTVVDAGGAGHETFEDFKKNIIEKCRVRVFAFLNIVGPGMIRGAEQDLSEMRVKPCAETIRLYPEILIGVKTAHFLGPEWEAVDRTVEAAELSQSLAMIDYRDHPERSYEELIIKHMRPGDMHTHMYSPDIRQVDENGRIYPCIWEAKRRGVLFDLGHGKSSFSFRIAKQCMEQGHVPDVISSDVHKASYFLTRATLSVTLSKLICMGMPLYTAMEKVTVSPARIIGREYLGSLTVGSPADIAVFQMEKGEFGFVDAHRTRLQGTRRLLCHMTILNGQVVWDLNGISFPSWNGK